MARQDGTVIIKKVKKKHGHGHHGGAWKVAYADFVTAMMAFFLLLWLLSATTNEQKIGIADYFAPSVAPPGSAGSDGVLGGVSPAPEGAMPRPSAPPSVTMAQQKPSEGEEELTGSADADGFEAAVEVDADAEGETDPLTIDRQTAEEIVEEVEEERFKQAEFELRQAIQDVPDLQNLAENLIIDRTPEGMRIQIVDQDKLSMFERGSAEPLPHTQKLLEQVAQIIQRLPNRIAISGHTDATPFASDKGYTNWELSSDRAHASRRMLTAAGLAPQRIASVVGKAETEPLLAQDPLSPRNRRISIVLLHEPSAPAQKAAALH